MKKLLSSLFNIYEGSFDALVCWSLCVVFLFAVCFAACLLPEHDNTTHQLQHKSSSKEPAYIHVLTPERSSFLIKTILTHDDGHIGRNMKWNYKILNF
jgi:hypothetical protein